MSLHRTASGSTDHSSESKKTATVPPVGFILPHEGGPSTPRGSSAGPGVSAGRGTEAGATTGDVQIGVGVGEGEGVGTGVGTGGNSSGSGSSGSRSNHHHHHDHQTLFTKALLFYIKIFRVVQPLASMGALITIAPVLHYFRSQTIFPAIQATLYVFTATLACCSLFFDIMYLMDVLLRKPLFWPFTNRHFRRSSKTRIGADLILCMVFCVLWFLDMIGLVIDAVWVDCTRLTGLEVVFKENRRSVDSIKTICRLEKATLGLAIVSWICWVGVLLVLLYGNFWKRRQVIAARLRDRLGRKSRSPPTATTEGGAAGVSSAISPDAGTGQAGSSISGRNGANSGTVEPQHLQQSSELNCQDIDGEVGLDGVIHRYDDERSSINRSVGRAGHSHSNTAS